MTTASDLARHFLDLHRKGDPLLLANVWDIGSARALASLGFEALATTSLGFAGTLGRPDGDVTGDEALAHAGAMAAATPLPVNADLEDGFADSLEGVAETVRRAIDAGLAGCSIEDYAGRDDEIYPIEQAVARVRAAAEVARADEGIVLTARCENYLHGHQDLAATIARLQAYEEAGAHVLYAPGLSAIQEIEEVVRSVGCPVNVLTYPGGPAVPELAGVGVARVSVGSAFYLAGLAAVADAAREWKEQGTHGFWSQAAQGKALARAAFE